MGGVARLGDGVRMACPERAWGGVKPALAAAAQRDLALLIHPEEPGHVSGVLATGVEEADKQGCKLQQPGAPS